MTTTPTMLCEQVEAMLLKSMAEGRLSHAYVFSGPPGSGKLRTALALAQALLCKERTSPEAGGRACGHCAECRKVEHGNHPDLIRIAAEGASIKIDQIRDLQRSFAYRAESDRPRMYMIEEAEKMTIQAANSLLKFLEEPGAGIIAILLTDLPSALLPTIASRVQRITFAPTPPAVIAQELMREGVPEHLARPASQLAAGLDAARQYAQSDWFAETRNVVIQLAKECLAVPGKPLLTVQQKVFKGELADHIEIILQLFGLLFKDIIHVQARQTTSLNYPDQSDWLKRAAFQCDAGRWVRALESVLEARKQLRAHVHPQLVLERLLVAVQEV